MALQALTRRLKTARNIKQITKAMEMVSASKMRRSQAQALASRPFSAKLYKTLQTIATLTDPELHPLLQTHEHGIDVQIVISTDRSLAGSLNTALFRSATELLNTSDSEEPIQLILIGQRSRHLAHSTGLPVYAEFSHLPDPLTYQDTLPISRMILQGFLSREFRSVTLIYMDFVSTLVQKFKSTMLLPLTSQLVSLIDDQVNALDSAITLNTPYLFEPEAESVLNWILPYYVELTLFQTLLEAKASEHSARMVAMKNASDNATEIINELILSYNKQRQAKITNELLDNTTSAAIVN